MPRDAPAHIWTDRYRAQLHMAASNIKYIRSRLYGLSLPAPVGAEILARIAKLCEEADSIDEALGGLHQRMRVEYREKKRRESPLKPEPE